MVDRLTRGDFNLSQRSTYTVIRFVRVSAKFGTCTVVKGTFFEAKMCTFALDFTRFIFKKCPIYTHDGAIAKFSTNSHKTDYSVRSAYTAIRFVSISATFGSCTVVGLNGTLVEAIKYELGTIECAFFSFNMCPF